MKKCVLLMKCGNGCMCSSESHVLVRLVCWLEVIKFVGINNER